VNAALLRFDVDAGMRRMPGEVNHKHGLRFKCVPLDLSGKEGGLCLKQSLASWHVLTLRLINDRCSRSSNCQRCIEETPSSNGTAGSCSEPKARAGKHEKQNQYFRVSRAGKHSPDSESICQELSKPGFGYIVRGRGGRREREKDRRAKATGSEGHR
jgi:hypothetical protein